VESDMPDHDGGFFRLQHDRPKRLAIGWADEIRDGEYSGSGIHG